MRCLPRTDRLTPLLLVALALLLGLPGPLRAEGIQVRSAELKLVDEVYHLSAQLAVSLNPTLEDALRRGVALNFVTEFELMRPRWYWLREEVATVSRQSRLSYNPLLRQYQVGSGSQQRSFDALDDALEALGEINAWPVLDRRLLSKRYTYEASLRMRLDVSQLPKPLQINALTSRKWELESVPYTWTMSP